MNLLKEYIRLILKEEMTEDIDMSRLSPAMVGVYSFAQAINKLIYEGEALPGAVPIDIIDAGKYVEKAPMSTETERKTGISFQYSGNSFKLYLDPTKGWPEFNASNETHDLVHAFTANIAKAFGRRRESVAKGGEYAITPSRYNKITVDKKRRDAVNAAFEKEFGFRLPDEVFKKPFQFEEEDEFIDWFIKEYGERIGNKLATKRVAEHLYGDIKNIDFGAGYIGQKYWAKWKDTEEKPSFAAYRSNTSSPRPFGLKRVTDLKQSSEDEEELGNKMSEIIGNYVTKGEPLPNPKTIVKMLMNSYRKSAGLTNMMPQDFKHRFDTPQVQNALIKLFQLYNQLLQNQHYLL